MLVQLQALRDTQSESFISLTGFTQFLSLRESHVYFLSQQTVTGFAEVLCHR